MSMNAKQIGINVGISQDAETREAVTDAPVLLAFT